MCHKTSIIRWISNTYVLVESASFFHKELQKMSVLVKSILILLASSSVDVLTPTSGAKILFLPAIVDSHVLYLSRLAADLAELGHTTTVVATANARVPDFVAEISGGNFNYKEYTVNYAGRRCSNRMRCVGSKRKRLR